MSASPEPGGPLPGDAEPRIVVRIPAHGDEPVDRAWVLSLVEGMAPAHVTVIVEVAE